MNITRFSALLCIVVAGPAGGQTIDQVDRDRCGELRAQATALHQERADVSEAEDLVALAIALETFDLALEEIAREYTGLQCGRSSGN